MKIPFLLILFFLQTIIFAQKQDEVIITTNKAKVYASANEKSAIIYELNKYEVYLIVENYEVDSNWVEIEVQKKVNSITGFIHKSEFQLLDNNPIIKNYEIIVSFDLVKATEIEINKNAKINYGLQVPFEESYVVKKMNLICKNTIIEIHKTYFEDLFNISFKEGSYTNEDNDKFTTYELDNIFYIRHNCSDGAGSYQVTWVIKDCQIIQRLIDEI